MKKGKPVLILMAEDDRDFYSLVQEAFKQIGIPNEIRHVEDGEELLNYLLRRGLYEHAEDAPLPGLIFLDLNMPRKNGFEALEVIRATPELKQIPVIMLTISSDKRDIAMSYSLGANSFVTKPYEFEGLISALKSFQQYWFETVELPG